MKNILSIAAAAVLALPLASYAAEDGHLWEMTSKMEMPEGMPEGMMGAMSKRTFTMCRGDDEREAVTKDKDMKDCEIKDFKQTDTKVTMTAVCEKGRTARMEIIYNKERSEYKGTMRVKDDGEEMTMITTGKKLGPCDAKKAKADTAAMIDKHKAQGEAVQAQYDAAIKKSEKDQIKGCSKGLDAMDPGQFGIYGACHGKKDKDCKSMLSDYAKQHPKASAECSAKADQFCELYQTPDGFHKVGLKNGSDLRAAGEMCGVKADNLRAKLCKGASKSEAYEFVGAHCPDQAKPLAKKHCAGRSYTVKEGDPRRVDKKWFKFCVAVAGARSEGEDTAATEDEAPKSAKEAATSEAKDATKKAAKGAAVNVLKGLFGQ